MTNNIQELFRRGKYNSIIASLSKPSVKTNLLDQLSQQNSVLVCEYLKSSEHTSTQIKDNLKQFSDLLLKCSGVPCGSDILALELTALWNFLYLFIKHRSNVEMASHVSLYQIVNRTLYRVCSSLPGHDKHKSSLFELNPGCKSTTYNIYNICLHLLQFSLQTNEVIEPFSDCCRLIFLLAALEKDFDFACECLLKLQELEKSSFTSITKKVHVKPHLALPFSVNQKIAHLEQSSKVYLTSYLIGCFKFLSDQWDEGIQYMDQKNNCEELKLAARYASGFGLYKLQKYSDAISILMETMRSCETMTQRLKAQIYNLIGMCFENMGKLQLSIQMYKEALSADFSFLRPLYNTSLQYRKLAVEDVELECLNLLVTALEMQEKMGEQDDSIDLLHVVPIYEADITYIEALYTFANRSLHLKRYGVAADKYKKVLAFLQSWETMDYSCIPPLLQIHHEAILALLKANHLTDCLSLCNKVISSYHSKDSILDMTLGFSGSCDGNPVKSSWKFNDSIFKLSRKCDDSVLQLDDSSTVRNNNHTDSRTSVQYCGKRKREENSSFIVDSSILASSDVNENGRLSHDAVFDEDVVACKYKAEVLFKLGQQESALASAQRAIDSITSYKKRLFMRKRQTIEGSPETSISEPPSKRARTTETDQQASETENQINAFCGKIREHSTTLTLEYELYLLMVRILKDMDQRSDALHFQRLAAQIKPIE